MKYAFIVLLVICNPFWTTAQKHNLYADVGTSPGFSATYNYKAVSWFGAGIGFQGYNFYRTNIDGRNFTPALYADIRFHAWAKKRNQFFSFVDLGMDMYKQDKTYRRDSTTVYNIPHNNGFYTGLGIGYFRRMTKNGGGLYASLKVILNWYTIRGYSIASETQDIGRLNGNGNVIFSIGYKFGYKPDDNTWVQKKDKQTEPKKKKEIERLDRGPILYITTSTGTNNNTAVMGFNLELPLSSNITIDAGPGTGTWNNKFYLGGKYYLKPAQRGFAFGGGVTYATGTRGNTYWITTIYGEETEEEINKNPQANVFAAAYKYWSLGRKYHRFYTQLGWSVPVSSGPKITQITGDPISNESIDRISSSAPGGLIVAFGFSFGIPK